MFSNKVGDTERSTQSRADKLVDYLKDSIFTLLRDKGILIISLVTISIIFAATLFLNTKFGASFMLKCYSKISYGYGLTTFIDKNLMKGDKRDIIELYIGEMTRSRNAAWINYIDKKFFEIAKPDYVRATIVKEFNKNGIKFSNPKEICDYLVNNKDNLDSGHRDDII